MRMKSEGKHFSIRQAGERNKHVFFSTREMCALFASRVSRIVDMMADAFARSEGIEQSFLSARYSIEFKILSSS